MNNRTDVFYPADCLIQLYEDGHVTTSGPRLAVLEYINRRTAMLDPVRKRRLLMTMKMQCAHVLSGAYLPIARDDSVVRTFCNVLNSLLGGEESITT